MDFNINGDEFEFLASPSFTQKTYILLTRRVEFIAEKKNGIIDIQYWLNTMQQALF